MIVVLRRMRARQRRRAPRNGIGRAVRHGAGPGSPDAWRRWRGPGSVDPGGSRFRGGRWCRPQKTKSPLRTKLSFSSRDRDVVPTLRDEQAGKTRTSQYLCGVRWSDYAIWWQVYPLGFLGAERAALPPGEPPRHRLPELADWLDHLLELGCNGLALGPVFASETHGYDTVDHFRVDPRLGSEDDLVALVDKAAAKGVRVLLDGVFNHVARSFARPDWFLREGDDVRTFEGHHRLVTLDHANPEVADYVTGVLDHWLDRGVAGWRFDAAYAVPLPFWRTVTDRARGGDPDAWFFRA